MPDRPTKVWVAADGNFFHDGCFEENESRADFEPVDLNNLKFDDECTSCEGIILAGPADDEDDDDEPEDDSDEVEDEDDDEKDKD